MSGVSPSLSPDLRDAIVQRLADAPITLAVLFGSRATGETRRGSDVDLAVEYAKEEENHFDTHVSLIADLTRIIGHDNVDVVRLTRVDPRIAVEALEHGERLIGSQEHARQLRHELETPREKREREIQLKITKTEQKIEQRIQQRRHG